MSGDGQLFEQGLAIRREVLGEDYVDKALEGADGFEAQFQQFVTEYCWGTVWARPGLPRQVRSLLNIAILTAINRPHELELHTRGALRNGCTAAQIQEAIMQVAVYCGVPAALDGLRVVRRVIEAHAPNGTG